MKRFFAAILLFTYLVTSTGFVVSTHYCMGKADGVQLGVAKEKTCSKCGMHTEDSGGCCRDEVKVVKLQQDLQPAKAILPAFSMHPAVTLASSFLITPFLNFKRHSRAFGNTPPLPQKTDIYLVHCVFRI